MVAIGRTGGRKYLLKIFLAYKLLQADRKAGYGLELPSGQTGTPQE